MLSKIRYWGAEKQNAPYLWPSSQLVRIKGFTHNRHFARTILQNVSEYPEHTFIIFLDNPDQFFTFPSNVWPVLHVSTQEEYNYKAREFQQLCESVGCEHKLLSIFCHEAVTTTHYWDWVFVSGHKFSKTKQTLKQLVRSGGTPYVEYFKGKRNLPDELNVRQIPEKIKESFKTFKELLSC